MRSVAIARHRASLSARLGQFLIERLTPPSSLPLIIALVACGYLGAGAAGGDVDSFDPVTLAILVVVVTAALIRLRAVDDLRDAAIDRIGRPDRPLPRGLVTADELRTLAVICAALQVALVATLGRAAFVACLVALACSLLSARDFFLERFIHRNLIVYALAHSAMVPMLFAVAWWSHPAAGFNPAFASLLLLIWGLSLGLEVTRKTMAADEERPSVETYSRVLGQRGATVLGGAFLAAGGCGAAAYAWIAGGSAAAAGGFLGAAVAIGLLAAALGRMGRIAVVRNLASVTALLFLVAPVGLVLLLRAQS